MEFLYDFIHGNQLRIPSPVPSWPLLLITRQMPDDGLGINIKLCIFPCIRSKLSRSAIWFDVPRYFHPNHPSLKTSFPGLFALGDDVRSAEPWRPPKCSPELGAVDEVSEGAEPREGAGAREAVEDFGWVLVVWLFVCLLVSNSKKCWMMLDVSLWKKCLTLILTLVLFPKQCGHTWVSCGRG